VRVDLEAAWRVQAARSGFDSGVDLERLADREAFAQWQRTLQRLEGVEQRVERARSAADAAELVRVAQPWWSSWFGPDARVHRVRVRQLRRALARRDAVRAEAARWLSWAQKRDDSERAGSRAAQAVEAQVHLEAAVAEDRRLARLGLTLDPTHTKEATWLRSN
jgi:hypothetical protein